VAADAEYTCVLRIEGDTLDVDAVDRALGLFGDHRHVIRRATPWRPALDLHRWQYPKFGDDDGSYQIWSSLEDALQSSVERLFPVRDRLESFVAVGKAYWWIGCFHQAPSSMVYLMGDLIEKLGLLGVPICLDNYLVSSDAEGSDEDRAAVVEDVEEGQPNHRYRFWVDAAVGPRESYLAPNASCTLLGEATDFSAGIEVALGRLHDLRPDNSGGFPQRALVCEHIQDAFDGGPTFSREHLVAIGELGLDLVLTWKS
jgi:hypothetical protein